ncbi:MAG: carbamate kinase [Candidatus Neomarinimicrobiota bacterium]|nr:MAG: carbamate kinase [Candidatus Neomarinimicrobiota bacterium]
MNKTAMIALGGNAISPGTGSGTITEQFARTRESLEGIMHFVHQKYRICLTHGNGPQVGDELLRMDLTHVQVPPLPLGVCVAGTQGTIGYMIQQSFQNRLHLEGIDREVVTLVTQVEVDPDDPSIKHPTKFVGHRYTRKEIEPLARQFGWQIGEQEPGVWRRVVPSPKPRYIMHGSSIRTLVQHGTIVIASGGGGIPVYREPDGRLEGLDAVIDKDLAAALMGRIIKAEELWIITDVPGAYVHYKTPREQLLGDITVDQARAYLEAGHFQSGSMQPKIEAALYFLSYHGKRAVITSIPEIEAAIHGKAGTIIYNPNQGDHCENS